MEDLGRCAQISRLPLEWKKKFCSYLASPPTDTRLENGEANFCADHEAKIGLDGDEVTILADLLPPPLQPFLEEKKTDLERNTLEPNNQSQAASTKLRELSDYV